MERAGTAQEASLHKKRRALIAIKVAKHFASVRNEAYYDAGGEALKISAEKNDVPKTPIGKKKDEVKRKSCRHHARQQLWGEHDQE